MLSAKAPEPVSTLIAIEMHREPCEDREVNCEDTTQDEVPK